MDKIVTNVNGIKIVNNISALKELDENNCTMPAVERVIYNIGSKAYPQRDLATGKTLKDDNGKVLYSPEVPVLATVVYFIDGTKVSVVNSQNDGLTFIDKTLSNGTVIKVASHESKERGLIYAIMKRLVSKPDEYGRMTDSGLGRILNELVDNAYDEVVESKESKIAKEKSKAAYLERQKNPVPKKKRYSINETLARINALLDKAETGDASAMSAITNLAANV